MNIERERFEAWLFSQPLDRSFKYSNPHSCAVCSFVKETTNHQKASVSMFSVFDNESFEYPRPVLATIPGWLWEVIHAFEILPSGADLPLTVPNMQRKYLELFPDTHLEPTPPHQHERIKKG